MTKGSMTGCFAVTVADNFRSNIADCRLKALTATNPDCNQLPRVMVMSSCEASSQAWSMHSGIPARNFTNDKQPRGLGMPWRSPRLNPIAEIEEATATTPVALEVDHRGERELGTHFTLQRARRSPFSVPIGMPRNAKKNAKKSKACPVLCNFVYRFAVLEVVVRFRSFLSKQ